MQRVSLKTGFKFTGNIGFIVRLIYSTDFLPGKIDKSAPTSFAIKNDENYMVPLNSVHGRRLC